LLNRDTVYPLSKQVGKSIREYVASVAREEPGHAGLLRSMRRRALHAEREDGREDPHIDPASIHSLAAMLAATAGMEQSVLGGHD